jgi:O-antigen/teichoic acid export membrane protein
MNIPGVYLQISHYNNAKYLKECIESVKNLDYEHLKILLINDGSTDNTKELCRHSISLMGIKIIHNESRLGRVGNYQNAYAQLAQEDWLINLDSDDYYTDKTWIQEAMSIVVNHSEDNICHIQSNFLSRISQPIKPIKSYGDGYFLISGVEYLKLCIKYYGFSHFSSIFKIDLLDKFGAYIDDCMHTDFLTAARAATQGNVLIGSKEIGVWRKHDGNQSDLHYSEIDFTKNQLAYSRFFEWCEDFLSFADIKKIIEIFESRELDRKLTTVIQNKDLKSISKIIKVADFNISKVLRSFTRLFKINSEYEKLNNIYHGVITRGLSAIITLVTLPFLLSYIGVADYSWIGIFTTIASAIYLFDFGLTSLITKEIAQERIISHEKTKTIIASQEVVYLTIGFSLFLILFLFSDWIAAHWLYNGGNFLQSSNKFKILVLALVVQWPHSFYTGALFGLGKQTLSNYTQLFIAVIKNIGVLFLFQHFTPSIELFFYWHIAISLLTLIVQKILIYQKVPYINSFQYFSWTYIQQLSKLALGISLISFFAFVYGDLNNFLLMRWLNKIEFGHYSILFNIITAYIMYCATVKSAFFPAISKIVKSIHISTVQRQYIHHLAFISYTLTPFSIYILVFRKEFLDIWIQDGVIASQLNSSFFWIILGSLCNALMIIPWVYLIAQSKTKLLIIITGFLAAISMLLLYILVKFYALEGAAMYWFYINLIPLPFLIYWLNKMFKINHWRLVRDIIFIPISISLTLLFSAHLIFDMINLSVFIESIFGLIILLICYGSILFYRFMNSNHKIELN